MKRIFTLVALCALGFAATAQSQQPTEAMMKQFRQTVQKLDISQRHLESGIPLADQPAAV